ncbi:hypothetical protein ACM7N6_28840 [Pseudomonas aeruginosa]
MTDINKLKELAVRALPFAPGEWFVESGIDQVRDCANDFVCETGEDEPIKASFIAAANPQAILKLIAEVERLRGQVDHLINQHMPREPIPDMPGWTRVIDADRLKAENEALRKIISECATACGAGCAPECTLEFMSMLPGEISSVVSRRAAAEIGKSMGGGE